MNVAVRDERSSTCRGVHLVVILDSHSVVIDIMCFIIRCNVVIVKQCKNA